MLEILSVRTLIAAIAMLVMLLTGTMVAQAGDVHVRGYYRDNGTYVQPHVRSAPDGNPYNNYSYGR